MVFFKIQNCLKSLSKSNSNVFLVAFEQKLYLGFGSHRGGNSPKKYFLRNNSKKNVSSTLIIFIRNFFILSYRSKYWPWPPCTFPWLTKKWKIKTPENTQTLPLENSNRQKKYKIFLTSDCVQYWPHVYKKNIFFSKHKII